MAKKSKRTLMPQTRFPQFKNDGPWEATPLGGVCDRIVEKVGDTKLTTVSITAGRGFVSQAEKFGRDISGAQYKNYILLRRGEFAYNKGNSNLYPQGCVYRLKEFDEAAASNAFICFRLSDGQAPGFYEGFFEKNAHGLQLIKFLTSGARSDGLLNINADEFFSVRVPLPPQPAEQRKIAECLVGLDRLIAAHERKLEALKAHKMGLMQQLFPCEGETQPRLRFPRFGRSPQWQETRLKKLGVLRGGLTYSPADVRDHGLLVLRSSNIRDGKIVLEDCVYVDPDIHGVNLAQPEDILICVRNGSKPLIGKNALIPAGLPRCTHGAFMTMLRAKAPRFVFVLLQTDAYQKQVAADLGATINSINSTRLLEYRFMVPKTDEQDAIANCLFSLASTISEQSKKVEALKAHKKGLMQQLFPTLEEVDT
jgi:type I restriction enzyme S subunit